MRQEHTGRVKTEAGGDFTSRIISGTENGSQEHTSRVQPRGVRRLHSASGAHGSTKGSRFANISQAPSSAAQVVCARSIDRALQTRGVNEACTSSTAVLLTPPASSLSVEMDGNVQQVVKQASTFDETNADDVLEWSSKLRVSLSLYNKLIFKIVQGSQRPSELDNNQVSTCEIWDYANHNCTAFFYFTTSGPARSVVRRFEVKTRENRVGHGQDAWATLRETFNGYSREAFRAAHR